MSSVGGIGLSLHRDCSLKRGMVEDLGETCTLYIQACAYVISFVCCWLGAREDLHTHAGLGAL